MGTVLGVDKQRFICLGDRLWHSTDEESIPVDTFTFGEDRIIADIQALALPSEQRFAPPSKPAKPRKLEGRSTRIDVAYDTQWRTLLGLETK